jgi:hypothetical protein
MTRRKPWIKTMDRETTLWNNDKEKTLDKNNRFGENSLKQ